jgi:hypothetical protein
MHLEIASLLMEYDVDIVDEIVYKLGARVLEVISELLGLSKSRRNMAHLVFEVQPCVDHIVLGMWRNNTKHSLFH